MSAAVIAAVTWVEETYVVVRFDPFQFTVEPETKPVPFTVRVKPAPPAVAAVGLRPVVVGTGLLIVKVWAFEVPPPGAGFSTVTWAVPAVAMSAGVIAAVNWVEETYVVVRLDPFQLTVAPEAKSVPFTVRVKPAPPAVAEVGLRLVVARPALLIVKVWALEVPPPGAGFSTVTWAVPAVAMSAAVIVVVNWVEETYVVVRVDPFQLTVEPETKPVPFTASGKPAPPAVAEVGLMPVVAGMGSLIVKVWALEVPPPGAGFSTVTRAVPPDAMSAAVIAAVNWVEETYVVVRFDPFHCTTEPLTKPLPFTVSVNPVPPAVVEDGLRPVVVGVRLFVTGTISKASHASSTPEVGVAVPRVTAVPDVAVTLLFSITAAVSAILLYEP
jgi:hypothetical protein